MKRFTLMFVLFFIFVGGSAWGDPPDTPIPLAHEKADICIHQEIVGPEPAPAAVDSAEYISIANISTVSLLKSACQYVPLTDGMKKTSLYCKLIKLQRNEVLLC